MFAGVLFSRENNWHNKTAVAFEKEFPYIRQQIRILRFTVIRKWLMKCETTLRQPLCSQQGRPPIITGKSADAYIYLA